MKANYRVTKKPFYAMAQLSSKPNLLARFQQTQKIFDEISQIYGSKDTQNLLNDMLNAGYSIHESAEILKAKLLGGQYGKQS